MQALSIASAVFAAWLYLGSVIPERAGNAWPAFLTGTYGDSFGVLTALFTGLALAGLWYTIQLQRIELSETREVLAEQSRSLEAQSKSVHTQVVEATLFQLLQRFSEVAKEVRYTNPQFSGRAAMHHYYADFRNRTRNAFARLAQTGGNLKDSIRETFTGFLDENGPELNHYFRTLYHVFKFIDENQALSDKDKVRYANVARAQLSTFEVLLLLYNSTTGEGVGFKYLVEQYGLLKHVNHDELVHASDAEGN